MDNFFLDYCKTSPDDYWVGGDRSHAFRLVIVSKNTFARLTTIPGGRSIDCILREHSSLQTKTPKEEGQNIICIPDVTDDVDFLWAFYDFG